MSLYCEAAENSVIQTTNQVFEIHTWCTSLTTQHLCLTIRECEFTDLSSCNPWSAWTAQNLRTSSHRQQQHVVTTLLFESEVWGSHGSNLCVCDTMYSGRNVPYRTNCLCLLFQIHRQLLYMSACTLQTKHKKTIPFHAKWHFKKFSTSSMNKNTTFLHIKILCSSPCTLPIHMAATAVKVQGKYSIGVRF